MRHSHRRVQGVLWVVLITTLLATSRSDVLTQTPASVDFTRDVQPLLREHCISCHGPSQQMQGLRLDRRRDALNIGNRRVIFPGDSAVSRLYLRVAGNQLGLQMPPTGALSADQIDVLKRWIDQGADWPDALAGEAPQTRPDPRATRGMETLRTGDRQAFRTWLREDPSAVNLRGPGGSTPLMYAALYGDADTVQRLLARGADPNIANDAGATPLMWAVDDLAKTRLLIDRGANVTARSADNRTPMTAALMRPGSSAVVGALLGHGAMATDAGLLPRAAQAGDDAALKMLIAHGADVRASRNALAVAVRAGCATCVDVLLESASQDDVNTALAEAAQRGDALTTGRLLDQRASANATIAATAVNQPGLTVLMAAAYSEWSPADTVGMLIERGGDVTRSTPAGDTALDLAIRHGHTPVVDVLRKAGAKEGVSRTAAPNPTPKPAGSVRAAIERSLPLLQRSDVTFLKKSGCVSCHNNSLTALVVASARARDLPVDGPVARQQLTDIASYIEVWRERILQGDGIPGQQNTIGYILTGMAAEHYPPNAATDALARFLKNTQMSDGRWFNLDGHFRPPIDSSDFQVTAMAIRSLREYAPRPHHLEYQRAVRRAADWLGRARPRTMEDRTFQLLGLTWAGGHGAEIRRAARDLRAQQREDGGWSQLPSLASDAYATGQALVALKESRALEVVDEAYVRGTRFLLNTQLEDGSWYVKSRAIPLMQYFESDFPHGRDQFISAAATNWATLALIAAHSRR